jgi:octaprenyl-diphosphate synthase
VFWASLERCTGAERKLIETIVRDRAFDGVTHGEILGILERYRSLEAAHARALQYAMLARNAICNFPDGEIKRSLLWAPDFVVAREK